MLDNVWTLPGPKRRLVLAASPMPGGNETKFRVIQEICFLDSEDTRQPRLEDYGFVRRQESSPCIFRMEGQAKLEGGKLVLPLAKIPSELVSDFGTFYVYVPAGTFQQAVPKWDGEKQETVIDGTNWDQLAISTTTDSVILDTAAPTNMWWEGAKYLGSFFSGIAADEFKNRMEPYLKALGEKLPVVTWSGDHATIAGLGFGFVLTESEAADLASRLSEQAESSGHKFSIAKTKEGLRVTVYGEAWFDLNAEQTKRVVAGLKRSVAKP